MIVKELLKKIAKRTGLYAEYEHINRLLTIGKISKMKKLPLSEKIILLNEAYEKRIGHSINWDNLSTYTEKMQWEKIYNNNPIKTTLSDKYLVREWVKNIIGEEYLIPIIGVWDNFDDINLSELPNQFVLKTNHGSGTNIIVTDKSKCKWNEVRKKVNDWMRTDFAYTTYFEMHYSQIERKILVEQYLETDLGELQDYKFLCFAGVPKFCWVDLGRYKEHTRTVFNMKWEKQPWTQVYETTDNIPKPQNFDEMIEIATKLCQGFSHVRVDLYNVEGKIYFGEMTFTNGSGMDRIIPEEYDQILGDMWNLTND